MSSSRLHGIAFDIFYDKPGTQSSRGFTLIEVLVALVILGMTIALVQRSISGSLFRSQRVSDESRATILADNMLARLGKDIPLKIGKTTGSADDLNWMLTITASPPGPQLPADQIELKVLATSRQIIGIWETMRIAVTRAAS